MQKSYVDIMDPSRIIRPIADSKQKGNVVCKVFWQGQKAGATALTFGGTVELPKHLFLTGEEFEGSQVARVGFLPESKATERAAREAARVKPRDKDRRRTRSGQDFEDEE